MLTINSIVGRPGFDWEILLQNVLEHGTFSPQGVAGTTLSLTYGTLHLDITGTNLLASANHTITSGAITGASIVDNGQTVITLAGLTLATAADFQTILMDQQG